MWQRFFEVKMLNNAILCFRGHVHIQVAMQNIKMIFLMMIRNYEDIHSAMA